jgi:hypothetical protein
MVLENDPTPGMISRGGAALVCVQVDIPRRASAARLRLALSSPDTLQRLLAPKAAPRRTFWIFISIFALLRGGAGGVRTHDLTDYESAALTS